MVDQNKTNYEKKFKSRFRNQEPKNWVGSEHL